MGKKGMVKKGLSYLLVFVFVLTICISDAIFAPFQTKTAFAAVTHPFMLIHSSDFAAMQSKSSSAPWLGMKTDAIATSNAGLTLGSTNRENCLKMSAYLDATALAYILDPANKSTYVTRIKNVILNDLPTMAVANSTLWDEVVPPANTLFTAIIALDTVYNDMASGDRTLSETTIENLVNSIPYTVSWKLAGYGLHGTWDVYKGVRSTPDDTYYDRLMYEMGGGATHLSAGYADARFLGNDRYVKSMYMDVLEHTGIDNRYYSSPTIINAYEHVLGYALTPFKRPAMFGDTALVTSSFYAEEGSIPAYRAAKFSSDAAKYAAWYNAGKTRRGRLLNYVIPDADLPSAQMPTKSVVYNDGGGYFRDNSGSVNGLMGALSNVSVDPQHAHKDTNAIYLAGYGEHLLTNSGYPGYGENTVVNNNAPELVITSSKPTYTSRSGADAFVRDGTYANTNYGTNPTMIVKSDLADYARKAYVKFSFSRFLEPSASNAKLRVYVDSMGTDSPRTIKVYGTSDESWTETGITWNNAPAGTTYITSFTVTAGAAWKEIDVTSYVNSNLSDKIVSFLLVDEGAASSDGGVIFNSREAAGTTYTWAYVNGAAWANNSLYTDRDVNHTTKYGGGLSEGFTSTYFDYAHGLDGPALLNDTHSRDFLFVHPQDGRDGYFIMRDGVTTAADGYAYTALHPNTKSSTGIATVTSGTEYEATINGYLLSKTDVKLNVFYATPPTSVTLKNGAITGFTNSFEGKYLEAKYQADSTGNARFLTLLFPSDSTHAKATMTRLTGSGYTGASVNHGNNIVDYVFTTSNSSSKVYNGVSYWGYIAAYRKNGTATSFYFIRSGKSFDDGAGNGFSSPSNVSIHMRGKTGKIETTSNVNVTFNYPGITGVKLDGVPATIVGSGSGYVTVTVPAGTKSVQLLP